MGQIIYEIKVGEAEFQQLDKAIRAHIAGLEKQRNKTNDKLKIKFISYEIENAMKALKAMHSAWVNNLYES